MSNIQWTDETWNPIVGCSRISAGCKNCYAAKAAKSARLQQFSQYQKVGEWNGTIEFVESQLLKPLSWRSPKKIFVCSMSDLFHENVPFEWIDKVFVVMAATPQHTYQLLTKRPKRMLEYLTNPETTSRIEDAGYEFSHNMDYLDNWPLFNVWLGVSVENQKAADSRIPLLFQTPAAVRFLSCEPLLESVDLSAYLPIEWSEIAEDWIEAWPGASAYEQKLHWLIVGGESGFGARECHIDWLRSLANQCESAQIPLFVKQFGANPIASSDYIDGVATTNYFLKLKDRKGENLEEFHQNWQVRKFPVL